MKELVYFDSLGQKKKADALAIFNIENNDYIIYTENKTDSLGNVEIMASKLIKKDNGIELGSVDDATWQILKNKIAIAVREEK